MVIVVMGVGGERVRLVYLEGGAEPIRSRLHEREHCLAPELLDSQLEALESPRDALMLEISEPVEQLVERLRNAWHP